MNVSLVAGVVALLLLSLAMVVHSPRGGDERRSQAAPPRRLNRQDAVRCCRSMAQDLTVFLPLCVPMSNALAGCGDALLRLSFHQ